MIEFFLEPWMEPLAAEADVPEEMRFGDWRWLWHQVETFERLARSPLVVNTSATGTGKTAAAHTHLLRLPTPTITLIVAPTNALVSQHAADVEAFVTQRGLPHQVMTADAASLARRREKTPEAAHYSNGRVLLGMLEGHFRGIDPGRPRVIVTNPDIFVRAVAFDYGSHARNLASSILGKLDYLVLDEVHYYDGVQLVGLFLALGLWAAGLAKRPDRRILLLTATPDGDLLDALESLEAMGLTANVVDPSTAGAHLERVVSLAPVNLRLEPLTTEPPQWEAEAVAMVESGRDGVILLDRLDQVSRLYRQLEPHLGTRVRRITGPTPADDRRTATHAPLVLATPTVDIGYNFHGRGPKPRQAIDQVWFQAPTLDRFWQRLGRAGRVLSKSERGIASRAVAAVPAEVVSRLEGTRGSLGRDTFAKHLKTAAHRAMDRMRLGVATAPASADMLHHAWAGMAEAASRSDWVRPFYERFPQAQEVPFNDAIARGRGLRELDRIRRRPAELDTRCRLRWLPWFRDPDERKLLNQCKRVFHNPAHPRHGLATQQLQRLAVAAGATLDAARAFRGMGPIDGDVLAWDELGLYLDTPGWVAVSLERLLRRHEFEVVSPSETTRLGASDGLAVRLRGELDRPRSVSLVLEEADEKLFEWRRGRVYGWDRVTVHVEREGAMQLLHEDVYQALNEQFRRRGIAVLFPFRPGFAKTVAEPHRIWPWSIWLGAAHRGEHKVGYVGTAAVRMEALLHARRREVRCPVD
ncbi:MAG: type I-D CRISPR-associated helicase Cas3' [Myxococcota bacterium]